MRIDVTKSFLPPRDEFDGYVDAVWRNGQLTNQGPLVQSFEQQTKEYLGVENFHFVSNGTIALQLAIRSLKMKPGEIITTPFTYVATTSAILWEHFTPVFVDIDPVTLCIDPKKIEAAITPNTRAILPVHVFGQPCDVEAIAEIANQHELKVIYDAAHAFGVKYNGVSILNYGDVSTLSFHATKIFHTIEGGAVVSPHVEVHETVELMKRFGHNRDDHQELGINAKATEFQAAMGLANLNHIDEIRINRKALSEQYDATLGDAFERPLRNMGEDANYAYYPVIFNSEDGMMAGIKKLNDSDIYPRRYFYPSLNRLPYLSMASSCPVSEDIASRILCLPLYYDLSSETVAEISNILLSQ